MKHKAKSKKLGSNSLQMISFILCLITVNAQDLVGASPFEISKTIETCFPVIIDQRKNASFVNILAPCGPQVVNNTVPTADNIDSLTSQYCTPQCAQAYLLMAATLKQFPDCSDSQISNVVDMRYQVPIARICSKDAAGLYCSKRPSVLEYLGNDKLPNQEKNIIICNNLDCANSTQYAEMFTKGSNVDSLKKECIEKGFIKASAITSTVSLFIFAINIMLW
jgi:hypothetical protein